MTRSAAKQATKGPLLPSLIVRRTQRSAGNAAASGATSSGVASPPRSRLRAPEPPYGIRLLLRRLPRPVQAALQQGVALAAGIAQESSGLAVRPLPEFPAVLWLHADRLPPLIHTIAAVHGQDAIALPRR